LARALEKHGVRPVEASVLMVVESMPGTTQSEIGRLLSIKRANMTPLVAKLEARGLVRRERVDGRSHGLVLAARAVRLVGNIRLATEACERSLIERVPQAHRQSFIAALQALWKSEPLSD
jgi:DNA-binding MarR family transcriptional regulator